MVCVQRFVILVACCGISVLRGTQAAFNIDGDVWNPINDNIQVWHQRKPRVPTRTDDIPICERPSVYICEEPPTVVSTESTKLCNYRNVRYQEQLYRWVAGRGCLLYTPDFLYVEGSNPLNLNVGCFYENLFAPCLELPKDDGTCGCYPFDPGLPEVLSAVNEVTLPSAHGRWESCFQAASECCELYMPSEESGNTSTECEATYDGWTCWPSAEADTIPSQLCSEFAYTGTGPTCDHYSSKTCYANGTWELQTDYTTCSVTPRLILRFQFYIGVLAFSIASCLPAVFVFFFYKRLRVPRVALHRNLLIAIILRNIAVIVTRSEIYLDELTSSGDTVMSNHSVLCRALAVFERAAGNAVFVCMLVEGIYLHRLIVAVFRQKVNLKWLYGIGAVITLAPVIAWATVMGVYNDHSCWQVYTVDNIQWIIDAPRMVILLVNTGLFIDILRVLLTKIRNSENNNQLNTTKATLFLMPLFGSQFLLTAFRPITDNCAADQAYFFITYTVEGLQGFIVAMLYCYVNKEVHMLIKSTYKRTEEFVSRVRRDSNYRRTTLGPGNDRRMTFSTNLDNRPIRQEDSEDKDCTRLPKLHVAEIQSLRISQQLAEILEPVYETVATVTGGEGDNDSGIITQVNSNTDGEVYVNASSSVDYGSVYDDCLNEEEIKYLEMMFGTKGKHTTDHKDNNVEGEYSTIDKFVKAGARNNKVTDFERNPMSKPIYDEVASKETNEYQPMGLEASEENPEDFINEIMEIMVKQNNSQIVLDPSVLSPNRKDDDAITFI